jgi:hypothetical protein
MTKGIISWIDDLSVVVKKPNTIRLFKAAVYFWLLCMSIYLWPIRDLLWGVDSLNMPAIQKQGLVNNFIFKLTYVPGLAGTVWFIHFGSLILAMCNLLKWIPRVAVVITGWMLYYAAIPVYNAGFLLFMLFATYAVVMEPASSSRSKKLLTNLGYIACIVQFLLVYMIASGYKLSGSTWIEGSSIFYTLFMDHFVSAGARNMLSDQKWLLLILNYAGLFYQLTFPFLVWWRRIKYPLLLAGIIFHGTIAFGLGLYDFGSAMVFGYILFLEDRHARKVLEILKLKSRRAQ